MNLKIEDILAEKTIQACKELFGEAPAEKQIQIQPTRKDFAGDRTIVVFPLTRLAKKSPEETANILGGKLKEDCKILKDFNVVKGFLNLELSEDYWKDSFEGIYGDKNYGIKAAAEGEKPYLVEYSSPNTNKPLHLGHVRNNLLGFSVAKILEANGHKVVKTNIVNDRGIHICKSMLAWDKWADGETPEKAGVKGDLLVGNYYVRFDKELKKEIAELVEGGMPEEEAAKKAPLMAEAQKMLQDWENGNKEVWDLWEMMNSWVYKGFDKTYARMGVGFDKIYYESETFKLGKKIVEEALEKGILFKKEDGSVWADLTEDGLDQKLLLRADGTAVYMTQDLGTAVQRWEDNKGFDSHVYVVGNEQNYHFQVLKIVMKKMGYEWADLLYHLSYGMVELPEGKMKSREGTVVDADDLMDEMYTTARDMSEELGKLDGYTDDEKKKIHIQIGMGALKYLLLKIDPKKNMTFNPRESVDFNGNTGPFIQYTHARINSVLRKAGEQGLSWQNTSEQGTDLTATGEAAYDIEGKEKELVKMLLSFTDVVSEAGTTMSPALIANYCYDLVKEYNQFYHDFTILGEVNEAKKAFRLRMSEITGRVLDTGMGLLGIEMPGRM